MDSPPGRSQRSLVEVASDGRSVHDIAELPSSRELFSHQRSDGSRLRCLSPSWDDMRAYAFPPFTLVREVLSKVVSSRNLLLTLVAPWWPQKEWFPDLQNLTIAPPVSLPFRRDLLRQPHFHRHHLRLHVLRLHAWRLSCGLLEN